MASKKSTATPLGGVSPIVRLMGTPLPEGRELMFMELLHATMRTQAASTSAKEIQRDITTPPVTVFEMRPCMGTSGLGLGLRD
jgi:hypothetical protein